ncbi:hypothetical protein D8674_004356 [Pyrus ussuriensis x Pyrus communis]|uniref:Uncharacterized protein n=1 Tax=Pyrus ussuriensis x Pyrus communis TaxID=2448454 RepID=A0A5N5FNX6_9ROSA|nr:hypothetical protein D8674_004356 [Pyrus ussuriensis x Pyrus communis]
MLCPNCAELTLVGTQHQCVRSDVITYSAAPETQGETSSRVCGDHKGEHHSLERGLSRRYQTKESPSSNSSSTSSSSKGYCLKCKQQFQVTTLCGTQHRCLCGYVIPYGAAAETQGEASNRLRRDHKYEHHILQIKESPSNNSSSTSSSSRNSFKQSYIVLYGGVEAGVEVGCPEMGDVNRRWTGEDE